MVAATKDEPVLMRTIFLLLGLAAASVVHARPGVVEYSDGHSVTGNVTLTPGKQIQFLDGTQQRAFGLELVREIRFWAEEETMERKWRFREAGKADKEFTGQPMPVRHVKATVALADGGTITGHLFTTVLYVENAEGARKVILLAKQRGEEGQTFAQLVYPSRIAFTDEAGHAGARWTVKLGHAPDEFMGLALGSLTRLDARRAGAGQYSLAAPLGEELLLGYRQGNEIMVGWTTNAEEKVVARVREGVKDAEDFFDGKELLGVWHDEVAGNVYSLMLLHRKGGTTLGGAKSQPWRVSVWRWKYDSETNQLMLAGRGDLFRGIIGHGDALPAVKTSEKLWRPKVTGQQIVVNEN
jgi:hypothetical protein